MKATSQSILVRANLVLPIIEEIEGMIFKEENILFPISPACGSGIQEIEEEDESAQSWSCINP